MQAKSGPRVAEKRVRRRSFFLQSQKLDHRVVNGWSRGGNFFAVKRDGDPSQENVR
jgi:hypothetical protein